MRLFQLSIHAVSAFVVLLRNAQLNHSFHLSHISPSLISTFDGRLLVPRSGLERACTDVFCDWIRDMLAGNIRDTHSLEGL